MWLEIAARPLRQRLALYRLAWWQWLSLGLALFFAAVTAWAAGDSSLMLRPSLAPVAWLMCIGWVVAGSWDFAAPRAAAVWRLALVTLALVLAALLVRAVNTSHIPVVLSGDEGAANRWAVKFITSEINNLFYVGWYEFPSLYFFIQSVFINLWGQTTAAIRFPAALAGAGGKHVALA